MTKLESAIVSVGVSGSNIMAQPAPYKGRYSVVFGEHVCLIDVEIATRKITDDPEWDSVWDQMKINGEHVGNRCGGVRRFSEVASAFILECTLKALTEESV